MDEDNGARHPALEGRVDWALYRDDPEYRYTVDQLGPVLAAVEEALTSGAALGREWILGRVVHHLLPTPQKVMEDQLARRAMEQLRVDDHVIEMIGGDPSTVRFAKPTEADQAAFDRLARKTQADDV